MARGVGPSCRLGKYRPRHALLLGEIPNLEWLYQRPSRIRFLGEPTMRHQPGGARSIFGLTLLFMAAGALLTPPARGADFDKLDCSAKLVPGDAAFYGAMLRNREQLDAILASKAWARLTALPSVKMHWAKVTEQLDQPVGPLQTPREIFKDPDNRQLLDLLGDMAAHEIFFYGGANAVDFVQLAGQLYGTAQVQRLFSRLQKAGGGDGGDADDSKDQARALLDALAQNPNLIHAPDLVVGFRVRDIGRAKAQLTRLEKVLQQQVDRVP